MSNVTFVVPAAPYHSALLERALSSITAQTVPAHTVVIHDTEMRGAGWARNQGLKQVITPFTVFLDADDTVEPTFVEDCLRAYDGHHYVYTDWLGWKFDKALDQYVSTVYEAPNCAWDGKGSSHIITTLLPTEFVRHVGGFDETLAGGEDTDLYWKITRNGLCGKRLAKPLFHYGKEGKRAYAFVHSPDYQTIMQAIVERYRGTTMTCGGCGSGNLDNGGYEAQPAGSPSPGDVLATALWAGNNVLRGRMTGRQYPRTGNGKRLWVNTADLDAMPDKFARVVEMPPPVNEEALASFKRLAHEFLGVHETQQPAYEMALSDGNAELVDESPTPDVSKVLGLYRQAKGA